jgi:RNA polymerase sigma factor (sigma-70 family)
MSLSSSAASTFVPWRAEPMSAPAAPAAPQAPPGACSIETVRELTSAVASGDPEALARLYESWFDFILAEGHRCTGRDEQFCLDVVQETMLRVIHRLKPLDTDAALAAWLRTAARSAAIDLLRKESRARRREARAAILYSEIVHDEAMTRLEDEARVAWLRNELINADPVTVRALDLRYRLNWTLQRIGSVLNLKTGAVDGRMNRAVASLRAAAREKSND